MGYCIERVSVGRDVDNGMRKIIWCAELSKGSEGKSGFEKMGKVDSIVTFFDVIWPTIDAYYNIKAVRG